MNSGRDSSAGTGLPVRLLFHEPRIPQNTGSTIRLTAAVGGELHLAGPLGFDLEDAKLRRAGLDYHDLAVLRVHEDLEAAYAALGVGAGTRVWAFTAKGDLTHSEVAFRGGDVLLFGPEPTGLAPEVLADERISGQVRIPMLPGRRSLNLSTSAGVAAYEAWRQLGYVGAQRTIT